MESIIMNLLGIMVASGLISMFISYIYRKKQQQKSRVFLLLSMICLAVTGIMEFLLKDYYASVFIITIFLLFIFLCYKKGVEATLDQIQFK